MLKMIDFLLINGTIITMDPERTVFENSALAIDAGRIIEIGPAEELSQKYQAIRLVDARRKIIMPGLIDCHGHAGHSMLGIFSTDTLSYWTLAAIKIYFHYCAEDFWYFDGLLGAMSRLRYGVTCGLSVMGCEPRSDDPVFAANHAKGYTQVGVRDVVCIGPRSAPWPHTFGRWKDGRLVEKLVSWEEAMQGTEAAVQQLHHSSEDLIRAFVTPFTIVPSLPTWLHSPPDMTYALTDFDRKQSRAVRDLAVKYGTRIHSDAFGNMIRLAAKDENALLGPDVILQHCLGITPEECRILAETKTNVAHSPEGYYERCPYPELIDMGVNAVITTDGSAPRNSFDLLNAMRKVQFMEAIFHDDIHYLPAGKLLEAVTIDAAKALGWDDEIGSLEIGKKADVIIINANRPHMTPSHMPVHNVVYHAQGADVETVFIDGKMILDEHKICTVDETAILEEADRESRETITRAGLTEFYNKPCWGKAYLSIDESLDLSALDYED
jgi:cytosine/adenosine deaminase-related metal-dependent hydrolase